MRNSEDIFLSEINASDANVIRAARSAIDNMDRENAFNTLRPLLERQDTFALYYAAQFSMPGETESQFERRSLTQLVQAAKRRFAPAIHKLAILYDSGSGVKEDKTKAAQLFGSAAELGHPHAQWIHGLDLLNGENGVARDERLGVEFIKKSFEARFEGAIVTVAEWHRDGKYGFAKDSKKYEETLSILRGGEFVGY